jgi:phosphatidylinositol phospholipase C, delta
MMPVMPNQGATYQHQQQQQHGTTATSPQQPHNLRQIFQQVASSPSSPSVVGVSAAQQQQMIAHQQQMMQRRQIQIQQHQQMLARQQQQQLEKQRAEAERAKRANSMRERMQALRSLNDTASVVRVGQSLALPNDDNDSSVDEIGGPPPLPPDDDENDLDDAGGPPELPPELPPSPENSPPPSPSSARHAAMFGRHNSGLGSHRSIVGTSATPLAAELASKLSAAEHVAEPGSLPTMELLRTRQSLYSTSSPAVVLMAQQARQLRDDEMAAAAAASSSTTSDIDEQQAMADRMSWERAMVVAQCKKKRQLFVDDLGFEADSNVPESVAQMPLEQLRDGMRRGAYVFYFHRSNKPKEMFMKLSDDGSSIVIMASKDAREGAKDTVVETLRDAVELRKGQKTTAFEKYPHPELFNKSFSLVWGFRRELNVVTETVADWWTWTVALEAQIGELKQEDPHVALVRKEWKALGQERVGQSDVVTLLKLLNAKPKKAVLKRRLRELTGEKNPLIDFEQFRALLRSLRRRPTIEQLFMSYASDGRVLRPGEFWKFLQCDQCEQIGLEEATMLLEQFQQQGGAAAGADLEGVAAAASSSSSSPSSSFDELVGLTLDQFSDYVTSEVNSAFNSAHAEVDESTMTEPLSHYFISSSHNSYLESNQLTGTSSVDMYIRVLKTGCRCIELDCWDGSDGEPIITHGGTLTSRIKVYDVVAAIRDWAFHSSAYPLILSLEIHLNRAQQSRMARIFKELIADMLPTATLWQLNPEARELPSPAELAGLVLLKGPAKLSSKELAELIYLKGVSFKSFSTGVATPAYMMSSFVEGDAKKLSRPDFTQLNKRLLARTYPKGTRVDSSNYDPMPMWNVGCQLVALNYQTQGPKMWVEQGKFRANGGSGYILKPLALRDTAFAFDADKLSRRLPVETSHVRTLVVRVISARQCPKPPAKADDVKRISDPSVDIEIFGVPCDQKRSRTKRVTNNGFSPCWNKEFTFRFAMSELAVATISLFDGHLTLSTRLAYHALPVESIRAGYRIITFNDPAGNIIPFCDLLCHFKINPA